MSCSSRDTTFSNHPPTLRVTPDTCLGPPFLNSADEKGSWNLSDLPVYVSVWFLVQKRLLAPQWI